jgi:murein DD-endopeptidase MepM/ murein hydrolase activator NlpD
MTFAPRFARALPRALAAALALACLAAAAESPSGAASAGAAAVGTYHVLQKGETLYSVAKTYGLGADAVAKANAIADPAKLQVGTRLLIPAVHRVEKGETLFGIAKAGGFTLEALREANGLTKSSVIKPGDVLILPAPVQPAGTAGTAGAASPKPSVPELPDTVRVSSRPVDAGLVWPCPGKLEYLDGKAFGILIRTKDGEAQKAVAAGTVSFADDYRGYGKVVMVVSKTGYKYVYGGNDTISVQAGDRVRSGQELGRIGPDAKYGGSVAYFLVYLDHSAVDPARAPRD